MSQGTNDQKKTTAGPTKKLKNLESNVESSLSVNMLDVALIEKYAFSDSANSVEKENRSEQRKSKRLSEQHSKKSTRSSELQTSMNKESKAISKSPKPETSVPSKAQKVVESVDDSSESADSVENESLPDQRKSKRGKRSSMSKNPEVNNIRTESSSPERNLEPVNIQGDASKKFPTLRAASKTRRCSEPVVSESTVATKQISNKRKKSGKRASLPAQAPTLPISKLEKPKQRISGNELNVDNESIVSSINSSASVGILNEGMITDCVDSFEKDSLANERKGKRSSGRRSSMSKKPEMDSIRKDSSTSRERNVEPVNAIQSDASDKFRDIHATSRTRRRSEPVVSKEQVNQVTNKKKKSSKRASLPAQTNQATSLPIAKKLEEAKEQIIGKELNAGNELVGSSLNSSASVGILNEGMITESTISMSESSETFSQGDVSTINHSKTSRRSSRSSFGSQKSTSIIGTPQLQKAATPTINSAQESTPNISLTSSNNPTPMPLVDTPNISLTSTNSVTPMPSVDPYSFPEEEESTEKIKKYKRRSSGSTGLSRKQTLLLFGSPRNKEVTPLRRSLGKLRQSSEPLMEDDEQHASPTQSPKPKKTYDPLPYVEEVENNSSPIKKPSLALRSSARSKRAIPVSKKLHRVSFGPNLSPEQFLRSLPPNTPVKKGATPAKTKRQSPAATKSPVLSRVAETREKTFKSPATRSSPQIYKKVERTPTPFKPDPKKLKGKPLLQQVLHASIANNKR